MAVERMMAKFYSPHFVFFLHFGWIARVGFGKLRQQKTTLNTFSAVFIIVFYSCVL